MKRPRKLASRRLAEHRNKTYRSMHARQHALSRELLAVACLCLVLMKPCRGSAVHGCRNHAVPDSRIHRHYRAQDCAQFSFVPQQHRPRMQAQLQARQQPGRRPRA